MKTLLVIVLLLHGFIHILGFVEAFQLLEVQRRPQRVSKSEGIAWLTATLLFVLTAVLYLRPDMNWWMVGTAAVLLSQVLIIKDWSESKWGTAVNLLIAIPVLMAWLEAVQN